MVGNFDRFARDKLPAFEPAEFGGEARAEGNGCLAARSQRWIEETSADGHVPIRGVGQSNDVAEPDA